ncbi:MAG: complex I subunit 5 family protein, partial [Rhodospirillales bacterium]
MNVELLLAPVFLPLVAALLAAICGAAAGRWLTLLTSVALLATLARLTVVIANGPLEYALADVAVPLGIRLVLDDLGLLMLWLVGIVYAATGVHARTSIGAGRAAGRFWPVWLLMQAALNALFLSADLFNIYVVLEIASLCGIALISYEMKAEALRAAMRYLLLALLASLLYLLGVAVIYGATGALDIAIAGARLDGGIATIAALGLITGGLLLKSAIFPLHGWLPPANGSAPAPVSAVLSALLVKASLYLLYRTWFWMPVPLDLAAAGQLLAALGAGALVYGSILALRQERLKSVVAYSTVAQLGYLMLVFALPGAWSGTVYHLLSHGLAKAAMFLAAGNMVWVLGSDRLDHLPGVDRHLPISTLAFALAAVSLMGLPPSGGFLAKWILLSAAWNAGAWGWVVLLAAGSLLAAAYLFRVLVIAFSPASAPQAPQPRRPPHRGMEVSALALALVAIAAGFTAAPVLDRLSTPP